MHVVLFDIDGTLISSGGAGRAALEAGLAEEFGITRLTDRLVLSGRTDLAILHDLLRLSELPPTEQTLQRLRAAYLRHLPARMAAHTAEVDPGSPYHARVLPGIAELVAHLAARPDVRVGLLTGNMVAGARIKLGQFGLFEHFAFGGFGDLHLDRDDVAREALAEASRHLGPVRPERVWVVGDTPLDVRCARAIGAQAVAVVTGWHPREELAPHQPDLLLDDLADPGPLLDRLAG